MLCSAREVARLWVTGRCAAASLMLTVHRRVKQVDSGLVPSTALELHRRPAASEEQQSRKAVVRVSAQDGRVLSRLNLRRRTSCGTSFIFLVRFIFFEPSFHNPSSRLRRHMELAKRATPKNNRVSTVLLAWYR